jgi:alpha-D-xyloside xylohydrolase
MRLVLSAFLLITFLVFSWSSVPIETRAAPARSPDAAPTWSAGEPAAWILGPIQGADGKERQVRDNLDAIEQYDLPITAFHFDAHDWQTCAGNGEFRYSDEVLKRMRARNMRAIFWTVPLIGLTCPEYQIALANDYFVRDAQGNVIVTDNFTGLGSWIDFDKPAAIAYYHTLLDRVRLRVGNVLGGFYTDNVRHENNYGEIAYAEAYALDVLNYTRTYVPDGEVVFKRFGKNTPGNAWLEQNAHIAYMNDLPTTFYGMKEGIRRVFDSTSFIPLAYNEFSGFSSTPPDTETYIRRMHYGAFQPVMENVAKTLQPWDSHFDPALMEAYRYYGTLHWELIPYLHSYDRAAYETHTPILRDMNSARFSARLGNEFFVKYVTGYTRQVRIQLPPGNWINYWNESEVFPGESIIYYPVPLGREPIFILRGAIIPMQVRNAVTGHGTTASAGALTVNVYPAAHSTFRYYDPKNGWLTFDVQSVKQRLALCTLDQIPSKPLIYRIAQVRSKPNFVKTENGAVNLNGSWGSQLPERASESEVAGSNKGWFYDALAKRLIVKLSALGTNCAAP